MSEPAGRTSRLADLSFLVSVVAHAAALVLVFLHAYVACLIALVVGFIAGVTAYELTRAEKKRGASEASSSST
jgi:multisubunit Na+/H+ antiporter MnhG subunit